MHANNCSYNNNVSIHSDERYNVNGGGRSTVAHAALQSRKWMSCSCTKKYWEK